METQLIAPVMGVLVAAAITPGPNNVLAMEAGGRGVLATAKVVLGVIAGSSCLLALIAAGGGRLLRMHSWLATGLLVAGSISLVWLGVTMFLRAGNGANGPSSTRMPSSTLGVAAFQLTNPKAWILVASVSAASIVDSVALNLILVGAMIAVVSAVCLTLWAFAGAALAGLLARSRVQLWFNRAMGALLAFSAVGLAAGALQTR